METSSFWTSGIFLHLSLLLLLLWQTNLTVDAFTLSAPEEVTGTLGGSVAVSCQYNLQFKENKKYLCKGSRYDFCTVVVKTSRNRPNNRIFITDDKQAGVFTATITSLRERDEDKYWCVISTPGRNIYEGVRILISHTATNPTTATESPSVQEISWWASLRWIVFVAMLGCLASAHITAWRIKAARNV